MNNKINESTNPATGFDDPLEELMWDVKQNIQQNGNEEFLRITCINGKFVNGIELTRDQYGSVGEIHYMDGELIMQVADEFYYEKLKNVFQALINNLCLYGQAKHLVGIRYTISMPMQAKWEELS